MYKPLYGKIYGGYMSFIVCLYSDTNLYQLYMVNWYWVALLLVFVRNCFSNSYMYRMEGNFGGF